MRKYTVQYFIAGYVTPNGTAVDHCASLAEIKRSLQREHDQAEQYGAAYEPSECLVWRGEIQDTTDVYPDLQFTIGPRGGVQDGLC